MKTFTQDGVVFNKYRESSEGQAVGIAPILVNEQEGVSAKFGGIINAVDIDWNGAEVDDIHDHDINTTGQLINYIKGAYSSGGSSQSGGFTADEITELQELISLDPTKTTTIKNLDSRISYLFDRFDDLYDRITKLEQTLGKITNTQLTNLINNASKVTLTPDSSDYSNSLKSITVELAAKNSLPVTKQVVGGLIKSSDGTVEAGVINISNDLAKKLDKTAINYDGSGNLTVDLD